VFCSDWPVPLRVDHGFWPSDLKWIEWPRSVNTDSFNDLIWIVRLRSNGAMEGERRSYRLGFRRGRRWRGYGSVVDVAGVLEVPGGDGDQDNDQRVMVESRVWSSSSVVSRSDEEAWPEGALRRCRQIPAQNGWEKGSLDAPEHGEEEKAREGTQLTGSVPELKDHRGDYCGRR
jgi:hypothetical protein